jgi:hypothetical protein
MIRYLQLGAILPNRSSFPEVFFKELGKSSLASELYW